MKSAAGSKSAASGPRRLEPANRPVNRLVDRRTGKPVTDAVIFAKRIDMAPDSMEEMVSKIEQVPSTEPGVYRFRAKLSMAGGWRLSLGAKVQGETGTVENKLVFQAVK